MIAMVSDVNAEISRRRGKLQKILHLMEIHVIARNKMSTEIHDRRSITMQKNYDINFCAINIFTQL